MFAQTCKSGLLFAISLNPQGSPMQWETQAVEMAQQVAGLAAKD